MTPFTVVHKFFFGLLFSALVSGAWASPLLYDGTEKDNAHAEAEEPAQVRLIAILDQQTAETQPIPADEAHPAQQQETPLLSAQTEESSNARSDSEQVHKEMETRLQLQQTSSTASTDIQYPPSESVSTSASASAGNHSSPAPGANDGDGAFEPQNPGDILPPIPVAKNVNIRQLAYAVAIAETGNCTKGTGVSKNNCHGIMDCSSGACKPQTFSSHEESYRTFMHLWLRAYGDHFPTLADAKKYSGGEGSSWLYRVKSAYYDQ